MKNIDWIIVGGGIVGLTIARSLKLQYPDQSVAVFEKEDKPGRHGSGRNSGVLHTGIYYEPGTLRATLCAEGASRMREYCAQNDLPILRIGKVIVAVDEAQAEQIPVLHDRATCNRVQTEVISPEQLKKLEPEACNRFHALYSPHTAVVDPNTILNHLCRELIGFGVELIFNCHVKEIAAAQNRIKTDNEEYSYGTMINAAGGHSDRVAQHFGIGAGYRILPFRGKYYQLNSRSGINFNGNVYPVPDSRMPFLGVHFTPCPDGSVYIGPTATPALGRENYFGLQGLELGESLLTGRFMLGQYIRNDGGIRGLVNAEIRRIFRRTFHREARKLVPRLRVNDLLDCSKRGIRAQLVDLNNRQIVTDFKIESGERSLHILNAPSPAFTSSLRFADYVVSKYC